MREFELNGYVVSNDDAWMYDFFEEDCISPSKVQTMLDEAGGEDVVVSINSYGGDLYSGINICDKLRSYGNVEIHVSGIAASAASIIAMGGRCFMSPGSIMMIHNAACADYGNRQDKTKVAQDLKTNDRAIAALYSEKTGKGVDEIMKMMDKTTFMTAQDALDMGFIDGILGASAEGTAARITNALGGMPSQSSKDRLREMLRHEKVVAMREQEPAEQEPETPKGVPIEFIQRRLDLLRRQIL